MQPLIREWIGKAEGTLPLQGVKYGHERLQIMMPSASMPNSALRNISKHVCKRRRSPLAERTIYPRC
jgi:hypothetical protein